MQAIFKPQLSYTIWFSQRTGSTLLCKGLASTGIAGNPSEWLYKNNNLDFLTHYQVNNYAELQDRIWQLGSTSNSVFGLKYSVKTGEWHRKTGTKPTSIHIQNQYSYKAINHLFAECCMREAAIQEFFTEGKIIPLTIVYEDFILAYQETIKKIIDYLEIPNLNDIQISPPPEDKLADRVSEDWVQRFRSERQQGWANRW